MYSSPDIIRNHISRQFRWTGHVVRMEVIRNGYTILVRKPEGKRSFERPRRRWEVNIKLFLREVGYDAGDWIDLPQHSVQ